MRNEATRVGGAWALFLFLQALYVLTSTGRLHVVDEASAFFQARDLVESGSLTVPRSTPGFEFYGQRDLEHYLLASLRGQPAPRLGNGFDRWFLFLHHAGVSWWPIAAVMSVAIIVAAGASLQLARFWRRNLLGREKKP